MPDYADLAKQLMTAETLAVPISPISETHPELGPDDAYRIQQSLVEQSVARGRRIAGYKIGLTASSVQRQMGVNEPDFGHLFADGFYSSGEPLQSDSFISPRVEPEIAFVLKERLSGSDVTTADVFGAVDYAVAALEIVDSRIADWQITLADTIADNGSAACVILGSVPVDIRSHNLNVTGAVIRKNGMVVETGAGAAVMGSPVAAVAWLARKLSSLGTALEAGSVVLSGAFTNMIAASDGDVITADFSGFGSVAAVFTETP